MYKKLDQAALDAILECGVDEFARCYIRLLTIWSKVITAQGSSNAKSGVLYDEG